MELRITLSYEQMKRIKTATDLVDKARLEITSLAREKDADESDELGELVLEARALLEHLEKIAHLGRPNYKDPPEDIWREGMVECVRCNRYDYPGQHPFEDLDFDFVQGADEDSDVIFCDECWAKD